MNPVPLDGYGYGGYGGYGGYYYDDYQDLVNDTRLGNPALYYDRQYVAAPGGEQPAPGRQPSRVAPAPFYPQVPSDYYQLTPEVSNYVGFGNYQLVPDQRKPQPVRPARAVTTKNLTDAEFKKITDGWHTSGGYTTVIVGGPAGASIQEDAVDDVGARKQSKWRVSQKMGVIPQAKDKKLPKGNMQPDVVYPTAVQSRGVGYLDAQPRVMGYPPLPLDQRMYPSASAAFGPYYGRAPAEVTYQPHLGYY